MEKYFVGKTRHSDNRIEPVLVRYFGGVYSAEGFCSSYGVLADVLFYSGRKNSYKNLEKIISVEKLKPCTIYSLTKKELEELKKELRNNIKAASDMFSEQIFN